MQYSHWIMNATTFDVDEFIAILLAYFSLVINYAITINRIDFLLHMVNQKRYYSAEPTSNSYVFDLHRLNLIFNCCAITITARSFEYFFSNIQNFTEPQQFRALKLIPTVSSHLPLGRKKEVIRKLEVANGDPPAAATSSDAESCLQDRGTGTDR